MNNEVIEVWQKEPFSGIGSIHQCTVWLGEELLGELPLQIGSLLDDLKDEVIGFLIGQGREDLVSFSIFFGWILTTHCWRSECNKNPFDKVGGRKDGFYGPKCSVCNQSFQEHPLFGKGKNYDLAVTEKRIAWMRLGLEGKKEICSKHGIQFLRKK